MAILVSIAVLITLAGTALARRDRLSEEPVSPADLEHADWLHEVASAVTGLSDLPRFDV